MATSILTLRAAIYARKSTDDDEKGEDKSVDVQRDEALAFAAKRGWTVDRDLVFIDDGISGAEFVRRPGLLRLLTRLSEFDAVIVSEQSRLGREQTQTASVMAKIRAAGVQIWCYRNGGKEVKFDTAVDKFMATAINFGHELEREMASERSRDALKRKAGRGLNTGGLIYGYDNVKVFDGDVKRHTDFKINAEQADVVRRIFRAYAGGHGHVSIAKALNGDPHYAEISKRYFAGRHQPSPRKRTGSWAPSSVRAMLYNSRYIGVIAWGARRKVYRDGAPVSLKQPKENILTTARPDLRIIEPDLWQAVQARLQAVRKTYVRDTKGQLWGRPGTGVESRYLLSGLSECGCCAHNVVMLGGRTGHGTPRQRRYYYGCGYAATRGPTVCTNTLKAPLEAADALVLDTIRARVMTPARIGATVDEALKLLAERQRADAGAPARFTTAIKKDQRELANYVRAVGAGAAPASVMAEIRKLEASIVAKEHELAALILERPDELDIARTKRAFHARLDQFNDLLLSNTALARQALRKLLAGRIRFQPTASGYRLSWQLTLGPLLETGYIPAVNPTGFEPVSGA